MQRRFFFLLIVVLMVPMILFAAGGKIKGKAIDKESKEPLIGANVSVEGTTYGAATDVNGEYTILNVPVGAYRVKATYVGYSAVTITSVRVNNELTTSVDFSLSSEAVALQAVEIVAERPLVNKSATNAIRIATSEDIQNLPVRGVNQLFAISPGVVLKDNVVFIRGGRQDEVGFYLEGVNITNPMVGGRAVTLVQDAIEEISIQAGGYNAEFGGANSGIIQTQLKSGSSQYKASLEYITDNTSFKGKSKRFDGKKSLGAYDYGYNELVATFSGPIVSERFKFFGLFNHNYNLDGTHQPYPGINVGPIKDAVSGDSINLVYPAGATKGASTETYNYTATMTMDFKPITVRLAGTLTKGTAFSLNTAARDAGVIYNFMNSDRAEVIDTWNGSGTLKITHLVNPTTYYEITGGYFNQSSDTYDPALGKDILTWGDSVANAKAGYVWQRVPGGNTGRYIRPNLIRIFDFAFSPSGNPIADYVIFRRSNISFSGSFNTQLGKEHSIKIGGDYQRYTMRNYSFGNEGAFGLAGLIAQNNLLPAGDPQKLTLEDIMINRGVNNFGYDVLGKEINTDDLVGPRHPVFASGYVQDKIEYSDLIINIGARYDYINVANYAFIDPTHLELAINKANGALIPSGFRKTASFSSVSPRLGLSFPVSEKTVFHAQFGKFVQQSRLRDIYQGFYATGYNIRGGFFIGTPVGFDVRPERTTQYEIGFTQQFEDFASFDITGYYKDIKDQIVYEQINAGSGSQYGAYQVFVNGDFATTKGLELTFNMRRTKRLQVNANLSFQDARGTGSFPNSNRGIVAAPLDGVTIFKPQYVTPLEFNNAVRGSLNFDYRFGKDDGGPILQQLGASALVTFNSGHPFTRGTGGADLEGDARDRVPLEALNSSTTPGVFQVDLRIDKTFRLFDKLNANIYIFVINLFDKRNVENVFLRTGSTDDDGYLSNPALGGKLIQQNGAVYEKLYRAVNIDYYERWQQAPSLSTVPFFFGPPRQVRFGIRLEY